MARPQPESVAKPAVRVSDGSLPPVRLPIRFVIQRVDDICESPPRPHLWPRRSTDRLRAHASDRRHVRSKLHRCSQPVGFCRCGSHSRPDPWLDCPAAGGGRSLSDRLARVWVTNKVSNRGSATSVHTWCDQDVQSCPVALDRLPTWTRRGSRAGLTNVQETMGDQESQPSRDGTPTKAGLLDQCRPGRH